MAAFHTITFPGVWTLAGGGNLGNIAIQSQMRIGPNAGAAVIIGLNGDVGCTAGGQMPAGWVAIGTNATVVGRPGGDQGLIQTATDNARAALLAARTRISYVWILDPYTTVAGGMEPFFAASVVAPFRITVTSQTPGGAVIPAATFADARVFVEYLWSASAGRA